MEKPIDPKVKTITKRRSIEKISFSEGLKYFSALNACNDHEDSFVGYYRSMKKFGADFEQLKKSSTVLEVCDMFWETCILNSRKFDTNRKGIQVWPAYAQRQVP